MLLQQVVNGLTLGSTYALIALGYTMVYGVLRLINFAHGEVYMIGAFTGLMASQIPGLPFPAALLIAMAGAAVVGVAIERIAYRPLRKAPRLAALISAIGMSIFLRNLTLAVMGPQTRAFPVPFEVRHFSIGRLRINSFDVLILVTSVGLMIGLHFLVQKAKIGKAMRATAQDMETASLMGIDVNRVIAFTFAVGSALAAAAGVLIGMNFNAVEPSMGMMPGLKGFVAAVLGGVGSIPGAMIGGILLGMAEVMGVALLRSEWRDAIAFGILALVLLIKPSGIFGGNLQEKV
ncbi:MAG TPA: branched-chain amino acid ABC transporter permease [Firmicutes bacterium]|nr:branched-chain amino acid ABC transporter permease [Candidatus Fermentithermobacillaceae bacterium]